MVLITAEIIEEIIMDLEDIIIDLEQQWEVMIAIRIITGGKAIIKDYLSNICNFTNIYVFENFKIKYVRLVCKYWVKLNNIFSYISYI